MKKLATLAMVLVVLAGLLPASRVAAQEWYDTGWVFRRPVSIENSSGVELTGYQAQVVLDSSFDFGKAKPDGSDLRVTDGDGITPISFWIEE